LALRVPAQPGGQDLVQVVDALIQVQHPAGQLADDLCGQVLSRQPDGLLVGGGQRGPGQRRCSVHAAPAQPGGELLNASPADRAWGLPVAQQQQPASAGHLHRTFQRGNDRDQVLTQPTEQPHPVGLQVPAVGDQQAQLGQQLTRWGEEGEVAAHAGLVGDHPGVLGVGLAFTPVAVTGAIDRTAGRASGPYSRQPNTKG
jgi:hypothetical protein